MLQASIQGPDVRAAIAADAAGTVITVLDSAFGLHKGEFFPAEVGLNANGDLVVIKSEFNEPKPWKPTAIVAGASIGSVLLGVLIGRWTTRA